MKIVVLDGFTLNPGDLSWQPLETLKKLERREIFERTGADKVVPRLTGAQLALTNKVVISREALDQLPDLRYIGVLATGFNIVDVLAARERGVVVTNVPAYGSDSVAQATFALLLELTNHVGPHSQTVTDGRWSKSPDFCYWDFPLVELSGLTFGIVGYGRIGRQVASIARAFGMNVLVVRHRPGPEEEGVTFTDLNALLTQSDVVSLHCPLTEQTRGIINRERLSLMKPTAFLLNTSRGPLIVEQDLAEALQTEKLAGAGLDVLSTEPPPLGNPLLRAPNCIITPHQAWATRAARARLLKIAVENIRAWLDGRPQNVVNGVTAAIGK